MKKLNKAIVDDYMMQHYNPQPIKPLLRGAVQVPLPGQRPPMLKELMNRTKPSGNSY